MAYKVDLDVKSVHGTNPQNLIERIVRDRIFASKYWKEQCFGLNSADLVSRAMQLKYAGGTFGAHRHASPFICLVLKLLMIQPNAEIVQALIQEEKFRYVRLLGAFYLRLVSKSVDVYVCLERLYADNRKFKMRHLDGSFAIEYIDNFVDQLLHEERVLDTTLPRLMLRKVLVDQKCLPKFRVSFLDEELEELEESEEECAVEKRSMRWRFLDGEGEGDVLCRETNSRRFKIEEELDESESSEGEIAEESKVQKLSQEQMIEIRLQLGLEPLK